MDLLPHQIIHLLALGMEDRAIRAKTIWMCAGCFTCAVRCPNDINITDVMDDLREKAVARDIPCPIPEAAIFHKTFIDEIARRGRVHELRMMGEYNLRTGRPFHNAALGPKMFMKGRLHLLPPRSIKGFKRWMKRIWNR